VGGFPLTGPPAAARSSRPRSGCSPSRRC